MVHDNSKDGKRAVSIIFGVLILFLAAAVCISLLLAIFPVGGVPPLFELLGQILFNSYGYSSLLVPVFFLVTAIVLILPGWSIRSGILLASAPIPFFTISLAESLFFNASGNLTDSSLLLIVRFGIVIFTVLLLLAELVLALYLSDILSKRKHRNSITEKTIFENNTENKTDSENFTDDQSITDDENLTGDENLTDSERSDLGDRLSQNEIDAPFEFTSVAADYSEKTIEEAEADAGIEGESEFEVDSKVELVHFDTTPIYNEIAPSIEPSYVEFHKAEAPIEVIFSSDLNEIEELLPMEDIEFDIDSDLDEEDLDGIDDEIDDEDLDEIDEEIDDEIDDEIDEVSEIKLPEVLSFPPAIHVSADPAFLDASPAISWKRTSRAYSVPFDILTSYPDGEYWIVDDTTRRAAAALKETLNEFRIQADVTGIRKGPVITMFEILPAPGVKLSKIVGLQDNIALRLAASSVRIVAPIPGKHAVGIEVPNLKRSIVSFRELIETDTPASKKMEIPVVLGKDISGEAQFLDLAATPHLLIAGATGSGKSVCVNSIILSILYKRSPEDVKLLLIDPKIVELKLYNDIAHLLSPVITEPKKAFQALQYCLCEMERRYALLDGMGVRDIKSYNRRIKERDIATEKLPYLVVIIDEFADLMATTGKELESTVARLCAMSRAVGLHLVLATQRPSIDVITGLIKANIPTRIAFMVASKMDSRIIIDQVGAEKLLGRGDMLYASATDPFPVRIQGAFVSEEEVERVVEHVKTLGEPEYIDDEIFVEDDEDGVIDSSLFSDGDDPLYEKALEIVLLAGKASASYIQRRLKIGYNRAARLVEEMEARGIVGPANGSKPREIVHIPSR